MKKDKFNGIVTEKLGYYVYCLVDPRNNSIFYVGKGKGNRVFEHAKDALKSSQKTDKLDTIREIINSGNEVVPYIIRHGLKSEDDAFMIESVLIDVLTYPAFNKEKLLTNIQPGTDYKELGVMSMEDVFLKYYDFPELVRQGNDRLLLVNISNTYNDGNDGRPLVEKTRQYWIVSEKQADRVDYILGVYSNVVICVCKPTGWSYSEVNEHGNKFKEGEVRVSFKATELEDSPYLYTKVPEEYSFVRNPVRYIPKPEEW